MKSGILLVNLGTPDSPALHDVRTYLHEFLTDPRVIEAPWLFRQFLVRGIIVPKRCRESAKAYRAIWTSEGSPLKVYAYRVRELLQHRLGDSAVVEVGMRYRSPSIRVALNRLIEAQVKRIIVVPMFPQYASATTGSVLEKVMEEIAGWRNIPELILIDNYCDHPALIRAFAAVMAPYDLLSYDHILLSFHGLPQEMVRKADPLGGCLVSKGCCERLTSKNHSCYSAQVYATARALVAHCQIPPERCSVSFQSRLGKEPWLQPYTNEKILALAKEGKKRVLVVCPAFTSDCLETTYEIGKEYAHEFVLAGGETLDLVPGLNDHPAWIAALEELCSVYIPCEEGN